MFNNSSNLYNGEWLALVFANRNKSYGAYDLRKHSSTNLLKAFFIAAPFFVALFLVPSIISSFKDENIMEDKVNTVTINDVVHETKKIEPKKQELPKETVAQKAIVQPKVKTVGLPDQLKVVADDLVTVTPPTSEELKNAVIATTSQDGVSGKGNAIGIGDTDGNAGGVIGGAGNGSEILDVASVDVNPAFPGGMDAWTRFIQKHLNYPNMARENEVQGSVFLSFVVGKDGMITDVKVIKGIGYGCDEEAVRVIKKSPRWKVGMKNNLPVSVRYNMPISYALAN